ncbi:MAG TPA: NADH-quinone oxidoreductase subunit L [Thermoanaerobaculia bacterium]|nr:NADH-quinone oxidoreductase subunit L [Thermoanaerobaculia bacterium]
MQPHDLNPAAGAAGALAHLWLIPALPFAGAALNAALGGKAPRRLVTAVALGAPLASLLVALAAIGQYWTGAYPHAVEQICYVWSATRELPIRVAFMLDPLAAVMTFVVTFVGFLIHVYSVGYMGHEEGYRRFFAYLNLFMAAMLILVLGNNFLVSFVGWEGVGLCSYLLIGYYYDQEFPPFAGKKAFIVNRVGDCAFLIGMFALAARFHTLDYAPIFQRIAAQPGAVTQPYFAGLSFAAFVALCLFIGAMGKSAQFPLYVWLPDAMAGPTPVSALIHAATMVTAGVYMCVRANILYQLAPGVALFVALIGAFTAIFAASIGLAQNDIKKVLAYSTVSQLGYMFLAVGVGAYTAAIFHLTTHAFFKALLFLGSGSVIHAMAGEQDMQKMGGLKKHLPITYWTFLIGALAIAGIPPLAGFFSKDEILAAAAASSVPGHWALWLVGLLTAGLTAFYMFRTVALTFHGEFRGGGETAEGHHAPAGDPGGHSDEPPRSASESEPASSASESESEPASSHGRLHLRESPPVMTVPLVLLALGAIAAGFLGIPAALGGADRFHRFLEPVIAAVGGVGEAGGRTVGKLNELNVFSQTADLGLMLLSVGVALAGIGLAYLLYRGKAGAARDRAWAERFPTAYRVLSHKYYVDELYDRIVVKPLAGLSWVFFRFVDSILIDGSIKAGAAVTDFTGHVGSLSTTGNVRNYTLYFFVGVILLFWWIVR